MRCFPGEPFLYPSIGQNQYPQAIWLNCSEYCLSSPHSSSSAQTFRYMQDLFELNGVSHTYEADRKQRRNERYVLDELESTGRLEVRHSSNSVEPECCSMYKLKSTVTEVLISSTESPTPGCLLPLRHDASLPVRVCSE